MTELQSMGARALSASKILATASEHTKNAALQAISQALLDNMEDILSANKQDVDAARAGGMNPSMLDRLTLTGQRVESIAKAVLKVAALPDPVGETLSETTLPNGLSVQKIRVPMGVIGIIYEARPNVTVDSAVLCLKAGSSAFLRGGKETINSNMALESIMRRAVASVGLPEDCIQLLHDTSRATAQEMMRLRGYIDVLIPRGGAGLIASVVENASVPVIETGTGVCHVYVDADADIEKAVNIIYNAKTQRTSVCNAAETLLVHKDIAADFLPLAQSRLQEKNVELRCDKKAMKILTNVTAAEPSDFGREFLDYILAVKVVDSTDEAIEHILRHNTKHSDCIVTENKQTAARFCAAVDSAVVYVNASTRFTDGEEMGFGAEIGISTQKLHARGPMGLREICSYKYIVRGDGQVR
ncbi:MAG: glutamate-5-semialdehyde dehydrogenase [Clostridia bacterium]|nr:glutamate-5-semialdehyde dehydrogenase [Clostridia bacterium]